MNIQWRHKSWDGCRRDSRLSRGRSSSTAWTVEAVSDDRDVMYRGILPEDFGGEPGVEYIGQHRCNLIKWSLRRVAMRRAHATATKTCSNKVNWESLMGKILRSEAGIIQVEEYSRVVRSFTNEPAWSHHDYSRVQTTWITWFETYSLTHRQ